MGLRAETLFSLAALEGLLNRPCENHSPGPYSLHLNITLFLKHSHVTHCGQRGLELAILDSLVPFPASQTQNKLEVCSPHSSSSTHNC